jgi:hypothetical protein
MKRRTNRMDRSVFGISHLMIVSVCLLACFPIKGEAESKTTEDVVSVNPFLQRVKTLQRIDTEGLSSFPVAPLSDGSLSHFCFVQKVRGYCRLANGTYKIAQLYGSYTNINFVSDVIDAKTDNPVYPPDIQNNFHFIADRPINDPYVAGQRTECSGKDYFTFYVWDDPRPADFFVGTKCDLHFSTGIYCSKGVPTTGAESNPPVGVPFHTYDWVYQVTVITNGAGEIKFTHP